MFVLARFSRGTCPEFFAALACSESSPSAPRAFCFQFAGLVNWVEVGGRCGITDFLDFRSKREEVHTFAAVAVEPLGGVSMLVVESRGDPDDDVCVYAGGVGDGFAEVVVV